VPHTSPNKNASARPGAPTAPIAPAKKRKSDSATPPADVPAPAPKKARTAKPKPPPLEDVSDVTLEGETRHAVPVFDTCDMIRRRIRTAIARGGGVVTQASLARHVLAAAFHDGRAVPANAVSRFMKMSGPLAGNTNPIYYAAYVYFEKLRVKRGEPKSKDRMVMETRHLRGVDTEVPSGTVRLWCQGNERPQMDRYGHITFSRR
jgi:hypothetical protein